MLDIQLIVEIFRQECLSVEFFIVKKFNLILKMFDSSRTTQVNTSGYRCILRFLE